MKTFYYLTLIKERRFSQEARKREVMVRVSDYYYKWAERLLPSYVDKEFQKILAMDPTRRRAFAVAPGSSE